MTSATARKRLRSQLSQAFTDARLAGLDRKSVQTAMQAALATLYPDRRSAAGGTP